MKRVFSYILACTLSLIVSACDKRPATFSSDDSSAYDFLIFTPAALEFGPDGGTQRMLASGDLAQISLDRLDQTSAAQIYGKPCRVEIMYGHGEQYPVVGDFGACTVTVLSPKMFTVTVAPGCEYGSMVLSGLAYDNSANTYLAPGGFTISVERIIH